MSEAIILATNWRDKGTRRREALKAIQEHDGDTLKDLIRTRLDSDENSTSRHTKRMYERSIDLWLNWLRPDLDESPSVLIHKADDDHVRDWLVWLRDEHELEVSSRNVYLSGLRYFYRCLVWTRAIDYNPASLVKKPSDRRSKMTLRTRVTPDELDALFTYLYSVTQAPRRRRKKIDGDAIIISNEETRALLLTCLRDLVLVRLLYDGGGRISSVVSLKLSDVYLHDAQPHMIFRQAKGHRSYPVPITESLATALNAYLPFRKEIAEYDVDEVLVNTSDKNKPRKGKKIAVGSARAILLNLYERAGIGHKYRGAHAFRHAAGSDLVNQTDNLQVVKNWLGHTSIRTTSDTYAEQTLEQIATKAKGAFKK